MIFHVNEGKNGQRESAEQGWFFCNLHSPRAAEHIPVAWWLNPSLRKSVGDSSTQSIRFGGRRIDRIMGKDLATPPTNRLSLELLALLDSALLYSNGYRI